MCPPEAMQPTSTAPGIIFFKKSYLSSQLLKINVYVTRSGDCDELEVNATTLNNDVIKDNRNRNVPAKKRKGANRIVQEEGESSLKFQFVAEQIFHLHFFNAVPSKTRKGKVAASSSRADPEEGSSSTSCWSTDTSQKGTNNFVLIDPEGARYSFIGNQLRCTNKCSTAQVSVKRENRTGPWKLHAHNSNKCPYKHGPGSSSEWVIGPELQQKIDAALEETKAAEDFKKKGQKKKNV